MNKFYGTKQNDTFVLDEEETAHINVLRLKPNDQILVFDGSPNEYLCKLTEVGKKKAVAEILSQQLNEKNPTKNITVYQALPKGDKLDLIVQKLAELGASNLFVFESDFTIAKTNENKVARLNKVSQQASKQCGRSTIMNVGATTYKQMLDDLGTYDIVLFANETDTKRRYDIDFKTKNSIAIIVGSEGGFSEKEISQLLPKTTNFGLGARILRCETASITLTALVNYLSDN